MSIMTNKHKLTIDHLNGNKFVIDIDNREFAMIMKVLLPHSYDLYSSLPKSRLVAKKDLHNDLISSHDDNQGQT